MGNSDTSEQHVEMKVEEMNNVAQSVTGLDTRRKRVEVHLNLEEC